jgi:NAD(P)-dependent dehydrogenase (short-subunit alcohol dehydrogenase family)
MPVVVITGASSGIGRATARAFARRRARLVLAGRNQAALSETAAECLASGAQAAIAVPTDVSDFAQVQALGERAHEACGGLDVWINNAGVVAFGRFEDMPLEAFRRVIDVNLHGYVHGARVAIPYFRRQGRGVLINNASMLSVTGWPYAGAYVASKFAIRGLSECLREELRDAPHIHVCTLMPAAIDTPIFANGANYTPWPARAVPPVYDAEIVARAMVALAHAPRRELLVGRFGRFVSAARTAAPALVETAAARWGPSLQFRTAGREGSDEGNLWRSDQGRHSTSGGWRRRPGLALGALALTLVAVAARVSMRSARTREGD